MNHLTAVLARSPERQQAFAALLKEQQTPGSPNFHKWLTPAQIGERFGVSDNDIRTVSDWLAARGFQVLRVSSSRMFIEFKGTTTTAQKAFGIEFHNYSVAGKTLLSTDRDPSIPSALAPVLKSFTGLSASFSQPQNISQVKKSKPDFSDCDDSGCQYLISPADFTTIYNAGPAYARGVTGTGQTIGLIGRARVLPQDVTAYGSRTQVAMPLPNVVIPTTGTDPGPPLDSYPSECQYSSSPICQYFNDQGEATLDVQRAGSVAYGANVDLIVSGSSATEDGVDIATEYAIDSYGSGVNANILSISFGVCEDSAGAAGTQSLDTLFQQAAAEGISVFVSSGDAAAAGCEPAFSPPTPAEQVLNINALCSSSYVTCVGGTEFNDTTDSAQYWSPTNTPALGSALKYIPEGAWNEPLSDGTYLVAGSGGGVSKFIATPSWQTGVGVPGSEGRYVPDVALSSSQHDGYFGCFAAAGAACIPDDSGQYYFESFAGTSASSPGMAGVMALVAQSAGGPQGSIDPQLYLLAANSSKNIFNDVTVASSGVTDCSVEVPSICNNSTPDTYSLTGGLAGYQVQPGFDEVTGLGSVNISNLITNWTSSGKLPQPTVTVSTSTNNINVNDPITLSVSVSSNNSPAPTGKVQFTANGASLGSPVTLSGGTATLTGQLFQALGNYSVGAFYEGDDNYWGISSPETVEIAVAGLTPTVTGSLSSTVIAPGGSVTITATLSGPANGPIPTGRVQFQSNGTSLGSAVAITDGTATLSNKRFPSTGTYQIVAQYLGDSAYTTATATVGTLNVTNLLIPTAAVSVSPSSIGVGGSTTFTATVSGASGAPLPTGSVQFQVNGNNSGSAVALSNGSATLPDQVFSEVGTYSVTASYLGDGNYSPVQSAAASLTVNAAPTTPTLTATPPNVTVKAGSSGSTQLTIAGFSTSSVTFACSGLPQGATCTFGALSGSNTASLQIATTGSTASLAPDASRMRTGLAYAFAGPGLLALAGLFRRRSSILQRMLPLLLVLVGGFLATGCGGSTQHTPSGTPPGTYNVTVTASGGSQTATATITLVVQ